VLRQVGRFENMCGRYVFSMGLYRVAEEFHVEEVDGECGTGGEISPGQQVVAVVRHDRNRLVNFRWGLIPSWAKDPSIGRKMFNARAETVAEKPSFRSAFRDRRCLVIAEGFYEWQKLGKAKKPMLIRLKSGRPFGFAGLYETWVSPDGETVRSCTIITTEANELIRPVHDRMPVILPAKNEAAWLAPENRDSGALLSMLKPYPAEEMEMEEAGPGFR
jgi:putative SOS response-associated peptidase YedK